MNFKSHKLIIEISLIIALSLVFSNLGSLVCICAALAQIWITWKHYTCIWSTFALSNFGLLVCPVNAVLRSHKSKQVKRIVSKLVCSERSTVSDASFRDEVSAEFQSSDLNFRIRFHKQREAEQTDSNWLEMQNFHVSSGVVTERRDSDWVNVQSWLELAVL